MSSSFLKIYLLLQTLRKYLCKWPIVPFNLIQDFWKVRKKHFEPFFSSLDLLASTFTIRILSLLNMILRHNQTKVKYD